MPNFKSRHLALGDFFDSGPEKVSFLGVEKWSFFVEDRYSWNYSNGILWVLKQSRVFTKLKSEVLRLRTSDFKNSTISIIISITFDVIFTHFAVLAAQRHQSIILWCKALSFDIRISIFMGVRGSKMGSEPPSVKIRVLRFGRICKATCNQNLGAGGKSYSWN